MPHNSEKKIDRATKRIGSTAGRSRDANNLSYD